MFNVYMQILPQYRVSHIESRFTPGSRRVDALRPETRSRGNYKPLTVVSCIMDFILRQYDTSVKNILFFSLLTSSLAKPSSTSWILALDLRTELAHCVYRNRGAAMTSFRHSLSSLKNNPLLTKARLETSSLGLPEIYGPVEIREICKAAKSVVHEIQKSTPQDQTADSTTQGTHQNSCKRYLIKTCQG